RLIADSHVLHRLLLPRHPPCALKHLHTPVQATRTQNDKRFAQTQKQRCSRPLCSSQTTTPTPLTTTHSRSNQEQEQPRQQSTRPQSQEHNSAPPTPPPKTHRVFTLSNIAFIAPSSLSTELIPTLVNV